MRRVSVEFRGAQLVFLFAIFNYPVVFPADHYEKAHRLSVVRDGENTRVGDSAPRVNGIRACNDVM